MQSSGFPGSAFPFSYLRPSDSPPGSSDGFSGPQYPHHHVSSHTGFLKATEYRGQRTIKYTPSFGGEDGDALRSIQRELESRMLRIGTNGLLLRTADNDEDRKDGVNHRKWDRADDTGNERFKPEVEDRSHGIPAKRQGYERRLPRSHQEGHVVYGGHGHVFHTDASGYFRKRHSDVDSGCHSDASDADATCLVLPLSPGEHPGLFDNFVLRTKFTAEAHAQHGPGSGDFLRLPVSLNNAAAGGHRKQQPSPQTGNCAQKGSHGYDHAGIHGYDNNGSHGNDRNGSHGNDRNGSHGNDRNGSHGNDRNGSHGNDRNGSHGNDRTGNHGYVHKGNHHGYNRKDNHGYDHKGNHGHDRHHRNVGNGRHGNRPETAAAARDKRQPTTNTSAFGFRNDAGDHVTRMYLPPPPAITSASGEGGGHRLTGRHVTDPPPSKSFCSSCPTRTLVVVLALLALALLVGFGAGFAAAWFGRQGAHSS